MHISVYVLSPRTVYIKLRNFYSRFFAYFIIRCLTKCNLIQLPLLSLSLSLSLLLLFLIVIVIVIAREVHLLFKSVRRFLSYIVIMQ